MKVDSDKRVHGRFELLVNRRDIPLQAAGDDVMVSTPAALGVPGPARRRCGATPTARAHSVPLVDVAAGVSSCESLLAVPRTQGLGCGSPLSWISCGRFFLGHSSGTKKAGFEIGVCRWFFN